MFINRVVVSQFKLLRSHTWVGSNSWDRFLCIFRFKSSAGVLQKNIKLSSAYNLNWNVFAIIPLHSAVIIISTSRALLWKCFSLTSTHIICITLIYKVTQFYGKYMAKVPNKTRLVFFSIGFLPKMLDEWFRLQLSRETYLYENQFIIESIIVDGEFSNYQQKASY